MAHEPQIYGAWADPSGIAALSYDRMVLDAAHLYEHWRRCSLSSDFWARYTALSVPVPAGPGRLRREAVESVLSYLLNELFENCAKFSGGPIGTVRYEAWTRADEVVFQLTNYIEPARQPAFAQFIQDLLDGDPEELYFRRLEESAETDARGSGLGYLTLMKDYGIRFGFRFSRAAPGSVAVEVQAHVQMEETE